MSVCIVERVGGDDRYPDSTAQVINAGGTLAIYPPVDFHAVEGETQRVKIAAPVALYASGSWTKVTYTEEEA